MKICFDKAKNERNITLRGLSFDLAADLDWDNANKKGMKKYG